MAESPAERLARAAYPHVDLSRIAPRHTQVQEPATGDWTGVPGESVSDRVERIRYWAEAHEAAYGTGTVRLNLDDLRWLLSQVPTGDREYRIEARRKDESTDWFLVGDGFPTREDADAAERAAEDARSYKYEHRVVSAPVQVWTVEEDQP